jgi:hypothetical protein
LGRGYEYVQLYLLLPIHLNFFSLCGSTVLWTLAAVFPVS